MIIEKQPDVVLCCYHSPDREKFDLLYRLGVGKTREYSTQSRDRFRCIPVNAFHPSYAVNHKKGDINLDVRYNIVRRYTEMLSKFSR